MKTLTLTQPWASLVALGEKKIETRSWSTRYTGPLAIHAAKSFPTWAMELAEIEPTFGRALRKHGITTCAQLPLGAVLATCRLVYSVSTTSLLAPAEGSQERAFGDYSPGRWMFRLEDVVRLEQPVPVRGSLGLWEWTPRAPLACCSTAWRWARSWAYRWRWAHGSYSVYGGGGRCTSAHGKPAGRTCRLVSSRARWTGFGCRKCSETKSGGTTAPVSTWSTRRQ